MPFALSIGVPYETFWSLNPKTLEPFIEAFRLRTKRENELKTSEIDISAWHIGLYVRDAIVSSFEKTAKFPVEPYSVAQNKEEHMTAKDHADKFREFLAHYKRPAVRKEGE